jgi:hypothetical protein
MGVQDAVATRDKMIHATRLSALDHRPSAKIRSYPGEPLGHWQGKTFVVEAVNFFCGKFSVSGPPCSEDRVPTELTHAAPDVLESSIAVNDPKTYPAPGTAIFLPTSEPGYETFKYACPKANDSMRKRLSLARTLKSKAPPKEAAGKK